MGRTCAPEPVSGLGVSIRANRFRRQSSPASSILCLAVCLWALLLAKGLTAGPGSCSATTVLAPGWSAESTSSEQEIRKIHFEVVARCPHDRAAFTQGLAFYDAELYESTGLPGQSSVRRADVRSGRVEQSPPLPAALFGEGLAVLNHRLVQLTWFVTGKIQPYIDRLRLLHKQAATENDLTLFGQGSIPGVAMTSGR